MRRHRFHHVLGRGFECGRSSVSGARRARHQASSGRARWLCKSLLCVHPQLRWHTRCGPHVFDHRWVKLHSASPHCGCRLHAHGDATRTARRLHVDERYVKHIHGGDLPQRSLLSNSDLRQHAGSRPLAADTQRGRSLAFICCAVGARVAARRAGVGCDGASSVT